MRITWLDYMFQRGRYTVVGEQYSRTSRRGLVMTRLARNVSRVLNKPGGRRLLARDVLWATRPEPPPFEYTERWWSVVFMDGHRYSGWVLDGLEARRPMETVMTYAGRKKMMQVRVPDELHRWFKGYAVRHNVSMTEVVVTYIESLRQKENDMSGVPQL